MKKEKRKKRSGFKATGSQQSPKSRSREMEPEELAKYVRLTEKQVVPLIKKIHIDAGAAQFLLAQYTQVLVPKNPVFSIEGATAIANTVLALWPEGYYTPGPEYPYTLEETLHELQSGLKAKRDYGEWFQPFAPVETDRPRGLGEVAGGIVKHPEAQLWQILMVVDGPSTYFGAYKDPGVAQRGLQDLVSLARKGASC